MTPLTVFLNARLDELETQALRWPEDSPTLAPDGHFWRDTLGHPIYAPRSFVLADVASKRAIVDFYEQRLREADDAEGDPRGFSAAMFRNQAVGLHSAVIKLAIPFAAHPDLDLAWLA